MSGDYGAPPGGFRRAVLQSHGLVCTVRGEFRCRCGHGPYRAAYAVDTHIEHQWAIIERPTPGPDDKWFLMAHEDAVALSGDRWAALRRFETTPAWTEDTT